MNRDQSDLANFIRDAFRGVTLGDGVGMLEGQGLDDYDDAETLKALRARDEKEDWSRIPVDLLNNGHSSLSFFDAEGMRFHLPAYLVAKLEGTLTQDVIFHLTYLDDHGLSRFELLSEDQREAVRRFLLLQLDPENSFMSPLIQKALDLYWKPRLA